MHDIRSTNKTWSPAIAQDETPPIMLVVSQGSPAGAFIEVARANIVVGRAPDCDLRIDDLTVSRRHCVVWRDHERLWLEDLGATNRTMLNGRPIWRTTLQEGDVVSLGDSKVSILSVLTAAALVRVLARPAIPCKGEP